jgi:dTDP-glucose 4,6-dehydratase
MVPVRVMTSQLLRTTASRWSWRSAVVAGGAGFVGSHLTAHLLALGVRVLVLDDLCTGSLDNLPSGEPGLEFLECDVTGELPSLPPVDAVFNLASPASPVDYQRLALHTLASGSLGTWHLLDFARHAGARYVMTSTSEVYGDPAVHPQHEGYWGHVNPVGPRSMYDEAKRFSEALTVAYSAEYRLSIGIVRLFNVYGPNMRPGDGRAVPTFITQCLDGKPVTVAGDGSQTRSCCYIDDVIEGLCLMMSSSLTGPVNIGNPEEVTILKLAQQIVTMTGVSSEIIHISRPIDDPFQRCPDVSLAQSGLNWHPRTSLQEGLGKTIAWYASSRAGAAK